MTTIDFSRVKTKPELNVIQLSRTVLPVNVVTTAVHANNELFAGLSAPTSGVKLYQNVHRPNWNVEQSCKSNCPMSGQEPRLSGKVFAARTAVLLAGDWFYYAGPDTTRAWTSWAYCPQSDGSERKESDGEEFGISTPRPNINEHRLDQVYA